MGMGVCSREQKRLLGGGMGGRVQRWVVIAGWNLQSGKYTVVMAYGWARGLCPRKQK